MQLYSQSEVFRTASPYVHPGVTYSFGDGKNHGINEICRCCKSDATEIKGDDLIPWKQFYKTMEYRAYKCNACGYMFSWYREAKK